MHREKCCFIHLKKLCKALHNFFRALKSSGFNFEDTHLTDPDRISKLLALVCIAFIWVYLVGIERNNNGHPIKIKNMDEKPIACLSLDWFFSRMFS